MKSLLLAAIAAVSMASLVPTVSAASVPAIDPKLRASMPDHTDPETAATLKCNACVAIAYEIHTSLTAVNEFRHGAADRFELFEILEGVCGRMADDYGLVVENNTMTRDGKQRSTEAISLQWRSSKVAPALARGEWITPMLSQRCARIVDRHEKKILSDFKTYDLADFTRLMCIQWDKSCEKAPDSEAPEL